VEKAVAFDLDLSLVTARAPNLELRQGDIVGGPVERGAFDLVTARAVLHHVNDVDAAIMNLAASLRPGGALLLIEPDFLSCQCRRAARGASILGRLARVVARTWDRLLCRAHSGDTTRSARFTQISGTAETAIYNGGSPWAGVLDTDNHRSYAMT